MIFEKAVVNMFKGMMYHRCDDTETVFYYTPEMFDGLKADPFEFFARAGHTLKGNFYRYDNAKAGRLVVFDHGFGGGHLAYMKEIERLARAGYTVFAYDHTGCMASGGESPNGLAQSLCDLNDALCAIKADGRFAGYDISVVGHSWGAFSTMNIVALHKDVSHIVAISGFVSVEEMINTFFPGPLKGYRRAVLALETASNPNFVGYNAVESIGASDAKTLLIYSSNDTLCRPVHYEILKAGLAERENVSFLYVDNKGHNPNYTEDAVRLLGAFAKERAKLLKKKTATPEERSAFVSRFDWEAMTAQDDTVWEKILAHLES